MSFCLHSPYKKTLEDNGKNTIMRRFPPNRFQKLRFHLSKRSVSKTMRFHDNP